VSAENRPALRRDLELLVGEAEEGKCLLIRDPDALALEVARFDPGVLGILEYLDGTNTLEEIQADLLRRGLGVVQHDQLEAFLVLLDRCLFLDNEHAGAERGSRQAFLDALVRPAAHAGAAYPAKAEPARRFFDGILALAERPPPAPLARLIAPHIDLELGKEVHAAAHRRLEAAGRPDVAVVLGTRHEAAEERFIACRKDFATPFGIVPFDAPLLDAVEERCGRELTSGQLAHRKEHSVEFQAAWLAHLWPQDPPAMVPLLVGSFHPFVEAGVSPATDREVERFIAALRDSLAAESRRVVVIASVDFSHVGPIYDDAQGLDEQGERALECSDLELLEPVLAGDAEEFFRAVAADRNARHVCGTAPVYVTLRLGEGPGELLRYSQGRIHPESGSVVSYAAVGFAG